MTDFETFRESFPDFAKDIKLNISAVLSPEGSPDLNESQIYGIALACAYTAGRSELTAAIENKAGSFAADEVKKAAKAAASIMAMNNVYYRFIHLVHDEEISKLPARLRMNIIRESGVPKTDFELMSLAVSAINGCGMCMESHTKELTNHGVSKAGIQSCVKIAAVINAAAKVSELK